MEYGIFIGYTFTTAWLDMARDQRAGFRDAHLSPLLAKYADRLRLQHFDAEAFSTDPTDFAFITTDDLSAYYHFVEELRDSPLITGGYAALRVIHIGLADGYREFERHRTDAPP